MGMDLSPDHWNVVVVSVEIVGWYTRTGVYLTGFAGTALGASSMAGGASLSGRGTLTGGARGFCLGSEESAVFLCLALFLAASFFLDSAPPGLGRASGFGGAGGRPDSRVRLRTW
ncbi:hypothetical protein BJ912DRAFT_958506 [Pholiota molesta]|nr:hypothetical protein BJ912DRAFT_958506 [Pholiota molesta]